MGLFGERSAKEPTGEENFANCNMKELRNTGDAKFGTSHLGAALFCPRSEDGATAIRGNKAEVNLSLLSKKAAEFLCGKCPYGSLDRVAGEELRIVEIDTTLARIAKQKELLRAQQEFDELQRTIANRVEVAAGESATAATGEKASPPEPPEATETPTQSPPPTPPA